MISPSAIVRFEDLDNFYWLDESYYKEQRRVDIVYNLFMGVVVWVINPAIHQKVKFVMYDSGIVFRQNGSSVLDVHVYIAMTYIDLFYTQNCYINIWCFHFCPL